MKSNTFKMQWLYLSFFLLIICSLNGCTSKPSEADARKAFENISVDLFKERGEKVEVGDIRINSFKKVNAVSGERDGVKFYKIEYDVEVECSKRAARILNIYVYCEKSRQCPFSC